ncbi:NAD(P)/FAD-dependent oxidoreductase [Brucella oryzae]|uniref:FAD-dependent oxidoreductase n=1 Tax=Brucella oryzae TaxID=335286 RepID=UPI001B832450|nr:FAD-dependent oxidoreductase [Brucella oryzae]MBR7654658.1 NAD(P)/FAD-dependent oxidoreductase [Brucella oryzae]
MGVEPHNDIVIIGCGPVALFSVFQLGLFGFRCHLIDASDRPGGQCTALYADKPIYDVPGFPEIMGGELVERLLRQIEPYNPVFHFNKIAASIAVDDDSVAVGIRNGDKLKARAVVIASGLGAFNGDGQVIRPDPLAELSFIKTGNMLAVSPETFRTSSPMVYAIGDACHYPGKLKLILSGFHEAALMTQAIRRKLC